MKTIKAIWRYVDSKRYHNQQLIFTHVGPIPFKVRLAYLLNAGFLFMFASFQIALYKVCFWQLIGYGFISTFIAVLMMAFSALYVIPTMYDALDKLLGIFVPGEYHRLQRGSVVRGNSAVPYYLMNFVLAVIFNR